MFSYIISMLNSKLDLHLFVFIVGFIKANNYFLKRRFLFALDGLIVSIYYDINNIHPLSFFILGCSINLFLNPIGFWLIYLSNICFGIAVFVQLIIITNWWIKKDKFINNYPNIYLIIKYILLSLILLSIIFIIIITINLVNHFMVLILKIFDNFSMKIKSKLDDYKVSSMRRHPRYPKDPKFKLLLMTKDERKEIKDFYEERKKLFWIQKRNMEEGIKNFKNVYSPKEPLREKRGWIKTIDIEQGQELSFVEQVNKIQKEFEKYDNESKKFEEIISNINNNKEGFYPKESKILFQKYLKLIKSLKINLQSMKTNLEKENRK